MKNLISLLFVAGFLTGCNAHRPPQTNPEYAKTSVSITLENKRSGGSGVILKSTPNASFILTNRHVCELIQLGGIVNADQGTYPVSSFRVYTKHDLCLVKVLVDLHENNSLAEKAPKVYSEAIAVGHPALLPTMITKGHYANKMPISLVVGSRDCDGTETSQEDRFFCAFTGLKPIIITLEAQPITATIMAGSSGSGVFNERGEIAGLVFAGAQGLSYGFIVPHEYVKDFLAHQDLYPEQHPNKNAKPKSFFTMIQKLQKLCVYNSNLCNGIAIQAIKQ